MDDYVSDLDFPFVDEQRTPLTPEQRADIESSVRRLDPDARFDGSSFFTSSQTLVDAYNQLVTYANGETDVFPGDEHAIVMTSILPMVNLLAESVTMAHRDYYEWWTNPEVEDGPPNGAFDTLMLSFPLLMQAVDAVTEAAQAAVAAEEGEGL